MNALTTQFITVWYDKASLQPFVSKHHIIAACILRLLEIVAIPQVLEVSSDFCNLQCRFDSLDFRDSGVTYVLKQQAWKPSAVLLPAAALLQSWILFGFLAGPAKPSQNMQEHFAF